MAKGQRLGKKRRRHFTIENQNSACFSQDTVSAGTGLAYIDEFAGPERAAWMPESAATRFFDRKTGNGMAFADKTVEAMVRELLWQEEETGAVCSSLEQEMPTGTGQ